MARFYEPDLGADPDSPFARDALNKLVRRSYWLDMNDRTLVMVILNGIGAHLTNVTGVPPALPGWQWQFDISRSRPA